MTSRVESRIRYNYTRIENPIFDEYMSKIGPYAFGVYGLLARIAGNKDTCFPGVLYLVQITGFSKNTILKSLDTLREYGLIDIEKRQNEQGGDQSNLYVLLPIPDTEGGAGDELPGVRQMHPRRSLGDSEGVQEMNPKNTDSSKQTHRSKQQQSAPPSNLIPSSVVASVPAASVPDRDESTSDTIAALIALGVTPATARDLSKRFGSVECRKQIAALPLRKPKDPAAVLVQAIKEAWAIPAASLPRPRRPASSRTPTEGAPPPANFRELAGMKPRRPEGEKQADIQ